MECVVPSGGTAVCFAMVVAEADGVLTCVFMGFAGQTQGSVVLPSAFVDGGGSANIVPGPGDTMILGAGQALYDGETWNDLARAGDKVLLSKAYTPA